MKTLDRYIIRSFLTSAALWVVVAILLRVVADLLINVYWFAQLDKTFLDTVETVVAYYGYRCLQYFAELGGVIIVAAAGFTLAMLNHRNELTAILASGVSLYRAVVPILLCAALLSGLVVVDREVLIPPVADKLVRGADDVEGLQLFPICQTPDGGGNLWFAISYNPGQGQLEEPLVTLRDSRRQPVAFADSRLAQPATLDGQAGWQFTRGVLHNLKTSGGPAWATLPQWDRVHTSLGPQALSPSLGPAAIGGRITAEANLFDPDYGMRILAEGFEPAPAEARKVGGRLRGPRFVFCDSDGCPLAIIAGSSATWHESRGGGYWELEEGTLFVPSDLTGKDLMLRRGTRWVDFMSSGDIRRMILLGRLPDAQRLLRVLHSRVAEPLNNLLMLLLGLPFLVSRERNIKASAFWCLLVVGAFFGFIQICQIVELPGALGAWLPILIFGPIAAALLPSMKS